jgi:hypothetical protein
MPLDSARRAIVARMLSYIAAGLGVVAGLAWNDAVKSAIDFLIPAEGTGVIAKVAYAVVITLVVGLALFAIERYADKHGKE